MDSDWSAQIQEIKVKADYLKDIHFLLDCKFFIPFQGWNLNHILSIKP